MANMPALQTGIAGHQIQEAWLGYQDLDFLVPAVPLFTEHVRYV
jgi:hypothetical protein